MKPDKKTCQNCSKDIPKGKWCSDKCRKAYTRNPDKVGQNAQKKADKTNPDTDKLQVGQPTRTNEFRDSLSKTDKTFYDRAMRDFGEPYYKFEGDLVKHEVRAGKCGYCEKPFKTMLALNRYCSYQHYHDSLEAITR